MFIVWGKKHVFRKLGFVADFCPLCRGARVFQLRRVGLAGHVYYITAGEGDLVGHDRTCQECNTAFNAEPTAYKAVAKKAAPLAQLINDTFPNLAEVWRDRLALEEQVKHAPALLSPEDRKALIRSPLLLLSPKVEQRFASTHMDKEVGFAAIGMIALIVLGPALTRAVSPDHADESVLVFVLIGLALVVWQTAMAGGRYMRREIAPALAKSLRPLNPSETELGTALAELKALGHKIGKKLRAADVMQHLRHTGETGPASAHRA